MSKQLEVTIDSLKDLLISEFGNELDIDVIFNGKKLYKIKGRDNFKIDLEKLEVGDLANTVSSLLMTGFVNLNFSATDGRTSETQSSVSTTQNDFDSWFVNLTENKILIPDTNTIMNRTLTSLSFMSENDILSNIVLQIPRLVILEMERKANQTGGNKAVKRKTFLSYVELMELKNFGAKPMRELERETLIDFSSIAGAIHTDALIRREIKDAQKKDFDSGTTNDYTLITSDMVNSLSAIAEGINTIYISKIPKWDQRIREAKILQICKLIISTAALFEKISISGNSKKIEIIGIWEGKNNSDWFEQRVLAILP